MNLNNGGVSVYTLLYLWIIVLLYYFQTGGLPSSTLLIFHLLLYHIINDVYTESFHSSGSFSCIRINACSFHVLYILPSSNHLYWLRQRGNLNPIPASIGHKYFHFQFTKKRSESVYSSNVQVHRYLTWQCSRVKIEIEN